MSDEICTEILHLGSRVSSVEDRLNAQDEQMMGAFDPTTKQFRPGLAQDVIDVKTAINDLRTEIGRVRLGAESFIGFVKLFLVRSLYAFGIVTAALVTVLGTGIGYVATHLPQLATVAKELSK